MTQTSASEALQVTFACLLSPCPQSRPKCQRCPGDTLPFSCRAAQKELGAASAASVSAGTGGVGVPLGQCLQDSFALPAPAAAWPRSIVPGARADSPSPYRPCPPGTWSTGSSRWWRPWRAARGARAEASTGRGWRGSTRASWAPRPQVSPGHACPGDGSPRVPSCPCRGSCPCLSFPLPISPSRQWCRHLVVARSVRAGPSQPHVWPHPSSSGLGEPQGCLSPGSALGACAAVRGNAAMGSKHPCFPRECSPGRAAGDPPAQPQHQLPPVDRR